VVAHGVRPVRRMAGLIRNLEETRWRNAGRLGRGTRPEQDELWEQIGIGIRYLEPGQALAMYHREEDQEDFLVLRGEGTLIVEGKERPLRQWDLFHCPPGTAHSIVGGPLVVLAVGARGHVIATGTGWGEYPVDEIAQRHGVGAAERTDDPLVVYADIGDPVTVPYGGWLR
jgi:Cupin domain